MLVDVPLIDKLPQDRTAPRGSWDLERQWERLKLGEQVVSRALAWSFCDWCMTETQTYIYGVAEYDVRCCSWVEATQIALALEEWAVRQEVVRSYGEAVLDGEA